MVGRPKTKISGHMNMLFGFQDHKNNGVSDQVDELSEEDVWGVVDTDVGFQESGVRINAVSKMGGKEGNTNTTRKMKIPKGGSYHDDNNHGTRMLYESAPVNIPDWSQILKSENCKRMGDYDSCDDGDEDYEEKIPPHELIAKQLARSQMISFSVFEGAGRTLKGRDLSRVRHAVWTRTGFLD